MLRLSQKGVRSLRKELQARQVDMHILRTMNDTYYAPSEKQHGRCKVHRSHWRSLDVANEEPTHSLSVLNDVGKKKKHAGSRRWLFE